MTDAWFENATSPDGVREDGCHPREAHGLEDYLRGHTTAEQAANDIATPTEESADPGDHLPNLWGLFHHALLELPDTQPKVIALLQVLQKRPAVDLSEKKRTGALQDDARQL